jgi:3-hydroxy-9,10-secoandrosta-1,3,5(10)-triene-9,17-dione monooxygenase reductase component
MTTASVMIEDVEMQQIDERVFRNVLGHFCTGVTVITSVDETGPLGFAAQSFHALSLDPPLISLSPAKSSTTWPKIRATGQFCVNILSEAQQDVSRRFAVSGGDKFGGLDWSLSGRQLPLIARSLGHVECKIDAEYDGGDHVIVIGRVLNLAIADDVSPLVFYRGLYHNLATP